MPPRHPAHRHTPRAMRACLLAVIAALLMAPVGAASAASQATSVPAPPEASATTAPPATTPATPAPPPQAPASPAPTAPQPLPSPPPRPPKHRGPRAKRPAKAPSVVSGRAPSVVRQRSQPTTLGQAPSLHPPAKNSPRPAPGPAGGKHLGRSNLAPSPGLAVVQAQAITAALASSAASTQALGFYRIPLFLLPIYKSAGQRYGVPWQVLAAINEVETNYGADLSVSTAGAVGWMQFMPATWLSYGVDALDSGSADPYNPVDAIFAAARYLRAAGAAKDLRAAVFAYNHSAEYVASVLLRARLISSYPRDVIATLTGLASARLPVSGDQVKWAPARAHVPQRPRSQGSVVLTSAPGAAAVAVQDGRIVRLGRSRWLGRFVVLQDVYGNEFTYAGLGSIAGREPRPGAAAAWHPDATQATAFAASPTWGRKVRLFAHPHNPLAAALATAGARRADRAAALRLHPGTLVSAGTALGRVNVPIGASRGHIRFAIRPAGDPQTIDPRPVLAGWAQLGSVLHPARARAQDPLAGATAGDAFLLTRAQLELASLSDPGVTLDVCSRHEIASGRLDRGALATIAYLSRSGLHPSVRVRGCRQGMTASANSAQVLRSAELIAINGVALKRHGLHARALAKLTIRTLRAIPAPCAPQAIWSERYLNGIHVAFPQRPSCEQPLPSAMSVARYGRIAERARQWQQLIGRIAGLPALNLAQSRRGY
jgi:Transglycosylase SLT domain